MKMRSLPLAFIVSIAVWNGIQFVAAYEKFQQRIPNGGNVRDSQNRPWPGVGHFRSGGGGERNPFGVDFAAAGFRWTADLCRLDSDCDGLTNGEELGDPACTWKEGDPPTFDVGITHPGFEDNYRGGNVDSCATFNTLDEFVTVDVAFPEHAVPTKRTTYSKFAFDFREVFGNSVDTYYGLKFEAILDNPDVVHHMILYNCPGEGAVSQFRAAPAEEEGMQCPTPMYSWAVGGGAFCTPSPEVGFAFDPAKPWHLIEIHYDNPSGKKGVEDASGVRITAVRAPDAAAGIQRARLGWHNTRGRSMAIPPGKERFEIATTCTFPMIPAGGVTFFAYLVHAHQIGRQVWTELHRGGEYRYDTGCDTHVPPSNLPSSFRSLAYCYSITLAHRSLPLDRRYDFDLQELVAFAHPTRVLPTDTLVTHCVYDSTARAVATVGGQGSDDEMCVTLFAFYGADVDVQCTESAVNISTPTEHTCTFPGPGNTTTTASSSAAAASGGDRAACTKAATAAAPRAWVRAHAALMVAAWGVLLPAGAAMPLLFRGHPRFGSGGRWLKWHRALLSVGVLCVIAAFAIAAANVSTHFNSPHKILGLVLVAVVVLQPVTGFLRPHKPQKHAAGGGDAAAAAKAAKAARARARWELYHKSVGRALIPSGWTNLVLGALALGKLVSTKSAVLPYWVAIGVTGIGVALITATIAVQAWRRAFAACGKGTVVVDGISEKSGGCGDIETAEN